MADPSTVAASSAGVWALVASWFTPTSLFLLINVMIATILISSRLHGPSSSSSSAKQTSYDHHHPGLASLARSPSLLHRLRSFNFSHHLHPDYHHYPAPDQVQFHYAEPADDHQFAAEPPLLSRSPSLLQRLKSVNFVPYIFNHPAPMTASVPEPENAPSVDQNLTITRTPSLLQRLKSINLTPYRYSHPDPIPEPEAQPAQSRLSRADPPPMAPAPSFLERVKSINFSLYGQEEPDDLVGHADDADHHVKRVNSDTKPSGGEAPARLSRKMRKSASNKSAFGHFRAEEEAECLEEKAMEMAADGEEIDAKADDFINRFKQQLMLQRLDSIMRYKELLTRDYAASN